MKTKNIHQTKDHETAKRGNGRSLFFIIPFSFFMLFFSSCSQDKKNDNNPVAVRFISQVAKQTAWPQAPAGMKSASGTRSGDAQITGRGVTSAGLEYIEYVAADGFLTREIFPAGGPAQGTDSPVTRTATGSTGVTEWVAGDRLGIFMLTAGGTLPGGIVGSGTANAADNREYSVADAAAGRLTPVGDDIYYPRTGTVDFIAYYPYGGKGTDAGQVTDAYIYKVSVAAQSTAAAQAAIDVLYSNNVRDKAGSTANPAAALVFNHALSKMVLNVKAGNGMGSADFSGITASLQGFPTTAGLALADGTTFTDIGGTSTDIAALKTAAADGYKATFEAVLIPQTGSTNRKAVFTVDGSSYTWTVPDNATFTQAAVHTYEITVHESGLAIAGNPAITPWDGTTGSPTPGTAEVLPVETVRIKAGTFQMGSPEDQPGHTADQIQHEVILTKDFWIGKYQVTNAQYAAFLNAKNIDGSSGSGEGSVTYVDKGSSVTQTQIFVYDCTTDEQRYEWGVKWNTNEWEPVRGYENYPVIYVSWYGAVAYALWAGGSLLTEAQWEYACRAGTTTRFSYGSTASGDYMWYYSNNGPVGSDTYGTKAVGLKEPNPWGLYDMHGNVRELCSDWYLQNYEIVPGVPVTDPTGPGILAFFA